MQKIVLSIPAPCHKNWQQMTPTEKGKFCGSCQKEVIDFTGMTDAELFAFFAQKNLGSVCGRTHISQLNTPIVKPVVRKKKRFWYIQYIATLLLLLTRPGTSAKAQIKPPTTTSPIRPIVGKIAPVRQPTDSIKTIQHKAQDDQTSPIQHNMAESILATTNKRKATHLRMGQIIATPADPRAAWDMWLAKAASKTVAPLGTCTNLVTISPNPINANGTVTINFDKVIKDTYILMLASSTGNIVQQEFISVPNELFNFQWQLDKQAIAGHYTVLIVNNKIEQLYKGQIIIQ